MVNIWSVWMCDFLVITSNWIVDIQSEQGVWSGVRRWRLCSWSVRGSPGRSITGTGLSCVRKTQPLQSIAANKMDLDICVYMSEELYSRSQSICKRCYGLTVLTTSWSSCYIAVHLKLAFMSMLLTPATRLVGRQHCVASYKIRQALITPLLSPTVGLCWGVLRHILDLMILGVTLSS